MLCACSTDNDWLTLTFWHWQVWQLTLTLFCWTLAILQYLLTGRVIVKQSLVLLCFQPLSFPNKKPWFSAAMRVAIHSAWCQCEPLSSQRTTKGWRFPSVAVAFVPLLRLCLAKVQIRRNILWWLMRSSTRSATSRSAISCAFPSSAGWKFSSSTVTWCFFSSGKTISFYWLLSLTHVTTCNNTELIHVSSAVQKLVGHVVRVFDCWTGATIRFSLPCCSTWSTHSSFLMQNLETIKRICCGCLCWQGCTRSWRTRVWVKFFAALLKEVSTIGKTFPRILWLGVWSFAQDVGIWQGSLESGVPVVLTSYMMQVMTCWARMDADCI